MNPTNEPPLTSADAPMNAPTGGPFAGPPPAPPQHRRNDMSGPLVFGVILILVGAYFLVRQFIPALNLSLIWPVVAIAAGIALIVLAFVRTGGNR